MANAYWTFQPNGTTYQAFFIPKGCTSFTAMLWGASGGRGQGAQGGSPAAFFNTIWCAAQDDGSTAGGPAHNPSTSDIYAGTYGTNVAGYVGATFNATVTSGAPTWPTSLYVAVGNNGQNAPSSGAGALGGWPSGGNGGAGNAGSGGYSLGYSGGGGGGGATVLMTSAGVWANAALVAAGAGGSGGGAAALLLFTNYSKVYSSTVNPPFSTYRGNTSETVTYLPSLPYEAIQQEWVANNGASTGFGAAPGDPGGYAADGASMGGGVNVAGSYGGGASTTAGGAAGASTTASGSTPGTAGAKLGSTTSATGRGGSGSGSSRFSGGGGGGGGYYQGGGGGSGNFVSGGGGGGGSSWASSAAVGSLPAPVGVLVAKGAPPYSPSAAGGPSGTGGFAVFTARCYPLTAKCPYSDNGTPVLLSKGVDSVPVTFSFASDALNSTNASVQMQAYRFGVSTDGGATITWGVVQALTSPGLSANFTIGAGSPVWNPTVTGTYDCYIDTQDTSGDWNTGMSGTLNACKPAHFQVEVYTPPAAPVVTIGAILDNHTDANGVTGQGVPVSWTHPGGTPVSSIVSLVDSTGAVVNTITISGSTSTVTLSWPNGNALGNKATVQYAATAGEYSAVGMHTFDISIDPPATPSVTLTIDSNAGSMALHVVDGGGTYPMVKMDVFRSEEGSDFVRIAAGIQYVAGGVTFTDIALATETSYSYLVRAYSQAGGFVETVNGTVTGS